MVFISRQHQFSVLNVVSADCQELLCLIFAAQWSLAALHAEKGSPLGSFLVNTSIATDSSAFCCRRKTQDS